METWDKQHFGALPPRHQSAPRHELEMPSAASGMPPFLGMRHIQSNRQNVAVIESNSVYGRVNTIPCDITRQYDDLAIPISVRSSSTGRTRSIVLPGPLWWKPPHHATEQEPRTSASTAWVLGFKCFARPVQERSQRHTVPVHRNVHEADICPV